MSAPITVNFEFNAREYQKPIVDAIENKGFKKVLMVAARRSGKDVTAWHIAVRQCLKERCNVYYVFDTRQHAKDVIWDSITNEGKRFIDFIPPELISNVNNTFLTITFINGSLLQLIGSNDYDRKRGLNPKAVVFSEYADQDPRIYTEVMAHALEARDGWALFISTPKAKNHLFDLYQIAQKSSDWFCSLLTLDDTKHIDKAKIQKMQDEGLISYDMVMQEWYCSFDMGQAGTYYGAYMNKLRLEERMTDIPWDPNYEVHTAWDIGYSDNTSIIVFQVIGSSIKIINSYENKFEGMPHYIKWLQDKPYAYGTHLAPHDIANHEWSDGNTRFQAADRHGFTFTRVPKVSKMDMIERVRSTLPRVCFDEKKNKQLIKCIENYRAEYSVSKARYITESPLHDWTSHYADALAYLCVGYDLISNKSNDAEIKRLLKRYNQKETRYNPIFSNEGY
jgi:phage terminase large subunit